ncbi:cellulose synthase-like protein B4 [Ricinus communis]|uniref:cellulose synthase-like protein B4 n=1 Tax=Ricinus communis TaxID=3988 RepID=UPI0007728C99|nr:cellulose synthase-like protein B4 [Ricinus communis]|eukprot:XP_015580966.1 cellulose synthase-like protein B4 [Ricinus communis]
MAQIISPPLYERISIKNPIHRTLDVAVLFLLSSLLVYRLYSLDKHGFAWFLALLCESWFTFIWFLTANAKWNPVKYKTYPEHLSQRVEEFLPAVDMFVTTADPLLEPPIITMNTVLSLLAVDYPVHKLACYVSDDGCSPLTYYSLVETSKFAQLWVPFCKKYNIQVRAPFRYFSNESMISARNSLEFQQEWKMLKDEYEKFSRKIQDAAGKSVPWDLNDDLAVFSNIDRRNHPSIIKVIWENKKGLSDGLPHLVYISREKRLKHAHHYKAGAMNVLTRVSGLVTNAPFMLNVDCDMYVNDPQVVRRAMCFLLGSSNEREFAFVQFPQVFYDELKDDPFGSTLAVVYEYMGRGIAGLQGPFYGGTGCFHRRKVIYGLCPDDVGTEKNNATPVSSDKELLNIFGNSMEFIKSAAQALQGKTTSPRNLSNLVETEYQVAGCGYEYGTAWGTEVGWQYGSTTEDVLTGLMIHSRGWRSAYCTPEPPAFLGCSPSSGPTLLTQQKRWATGLVEILVCRKSPIVTAITAKLQFRQCLVYLFILTWGLRSIPELCYMLLPAYCIISNSNFLPKFNEPPIYGYIALIIVYSLYTILEYLQTGLSIRAWWNKQKMARVITTSAWLIGVLSVVLKILGISETVFEVTQKDQLNDNDSDSNVCKFTFDESPLFIPGTTILLIELAALIMGFFSGGLLQSQIGEILCSILVVMFFWLFFKGLFRKDKYGIPLPTICKSVVLASSFVYFCKWLSLD